jgi:hypothetical protein
MTIESHLTVGAILYLAVFVNIKNVGNVLKNLMKNFEKGR